MMTRNGDGSGQTTVLEGATGTVTRKPTSDFPIQVCQKWGNDFRHVIRQFMQSKTMRQ